MEIQVIHLFNGIIFTNHGYHALIQLNVNTKIKWYIISTSNQCLIGPIQVDDTYKVTIDQTIVNELGDDINGLIIESIDNTDIIDDFPQWMINSLAKNIEIN